MSGFSYKFYERISNLACSVKSIISFPQNIMGINKIIDKPTYYPDMERKSKAEMWKDNFLWLCRDRELNQFYTSYGLDIKGLHSSNDFISHRKFCRMRDAGNQIEKLTISGHYNYITLLRDKYIFSAYIASTIGKKYSVPTVALISGGRAFMLETGIWMDLNLFLRKDSEFVYKVIDGECADGVIEARVKGNDVLIDKSVYSKTEFIDKLCKKRYLVQKIIEQHPDLQAFQTRSVNTIRIVTIRGKSGTINILAAFLRLSTSKNSFVDNRAKGGLGVGVQLESGKLMKYGFFHDTFGTKIDICPNSGIHFEEYQLPYWTESVELVCNAHRQFYELQSIGWDVVITNNGPVLLEGNDDWEIGGPQDTYGGLKKRWFELIEQ